MSSTTHATDTAAVIIISSSDNVRSWFSLRQTWGQPSHTVTHPLLSSQPHDFDVVMATAAHSYLTDLPWDKGKEMKEQGFLCFCMIMWKSLSTVGVPLIDDSGIMWALLSYALEVKISLRGRCGEHYSHLLLAWGQSSECSTISGIHKMTLWSDWRNCSFSEVLRYEPNPYGFLSGSYVTNPHV